MKHRRYLRLSDTAIQDLKTQVTFRRISRGEIQITTPHGMTYLSKDEEAGALWGYLQTQAQEK